MNIRASKKTTFVSLIIFIGATVLLVFAGLPMYAGLWHLFHGASAKCGEFTITVPEGWWARDGGCSLVTPSPAYTLKQKVPVQVFFNIQSTPSVKDGQWRGDVIERLKQDGSIFEGTTELSVASTPTVCFQYRMPSKLQRASAINCSVDGRMVITFFYDDPMLTNDFYKILRGIQASSTPRQ